MQMPRQLFFCRKSPRIGPCFSMFVVVVCFLGQNTSQPQHACWHFYLVTLLSTSDNLRYMSCVRLLPECNAWKMTRVYGPQIPKTLQTYKSLTGIWKLVKRHDIVLRECDRFLVLPRKVCLCSASCVRLALFTFVLKHHIAQYSSIFRNHPYFTCCQLVQVLALVAGVEVEAIVQEDGASLTKDREPIRATRVSRKGGPDLLRSFPESKLPRSVDGKPARPNVLMFGDGGVNVRVIDEQYHRFQNWLKEIPTAARLVIVEVGAGKAVPTIRCTSEEVLRKYKNAFLVRINLDDSDVPHELSTRSVSIGGMGALEALTQIDQTLKKWSKWSAETQKSNAWWPDGVIRVKVSGQCLLNPEDCTEAEEMWSQNEDWADFQWWKSFNILQYERNSEQAWTS